MTRNPQLKTIIPIFVKGILTAIWQPRFVGVSASHLGACLLIHTETHGPVALDLVEKVTVTPGTVDTYQLGACPGMFDSAEYAEVQITACKQKTNHASQRLTNTMFKNNDCLTEFL